MQHANFNRTIIKPPVKPVDEWVSVVNKRVTMKRHDNIAVRLSHTKGNIDTMTITLNIGKDVADILGWESGFIIEPLLNEAQPMLLKLVYRQNNEYGYKFASNPSSAHRFYIKMAIPAIPNYVVNVTRNVPFVLNANEVIVDLSEFSGQTVPHIRG